MKMINRLFSSFDPMSAPLRINYICLILGPIFLITHLQVIRSRKLSTEKILKFFVEQELTAILNNTNIQGKLLIFSRLFFTILVLNTAGLIPYVFTIRAHLSFTLRVAIPLWLGFILFRFTKNTNHFLSHIVPLSTPLILSQFITLIETIRQIIRPITLSVRLAANITAGHILIALARRPILIINHFTLILIILLLLEIAVAFIQRYVFIILLSIYLAETY